MTVPKLYPVVFTMGFFSYLNEYCFAWNNDYFSSHLPLQTAYACPSTSYSFAIADIHLPI